MKNYWADPFARILKLSDAEIGQLVRRPGEVIPGVHDLPTAASTELLRKGLRKIYAPSPQAIGFIRHVLGRADGHALARYPSLDSFNEGMHRELAEFDAVPATCLTGITGSGKSHLVEALGRLIPAPAVLALPDGTKVPTKLGATFKINHQASAVGVNASLFNALGLAREEEQVKTISLPKLSKRCYVRGACLAVADEMQFFTSSPSANTLVTKTMLGLTYLGLPVTFVLNYSLLHLLIKRNKEECDRLLSDVLLLEPDNPESPALSEMIRQWCVVADGAFDLDHQDAGDLLDRFSGGSKRVMLELALTSYRRKREGSRKSRSVIVGLGDLEDTFRSHEFSEIRKDAAELLQIRVTGKLREASRKGLLCPLQPAIRLKDRAQEAADHALQSEVDRAVLNSSMSPQERRDAAAIQRTLQPDDTQPVKEKTVRRKMAPLTLAGMLKFVKT